MNTSRTFRFNSNEGLNYTVRCVVGNRNYIVISINKNPLVINTYKTIYEAVKDRQNLMIIMDLLGLIKEYKGTPLINKI
ncbi:hypothetical protein BA195_11495 [Tenacibaculum soleae]|uniref:Uncharacterized protein n=1 Tax=Tenacibaculum soleae TaxID=447689 RepID=A0A1B9XXS8_9FLAO|nr:hypothetical protein [Tenacibaculum soleae]OCK42241.1 hypothetical protein BA195_11495 [Tenacibaculum soleae]